MKREGRESAGFWAEKSPIAPCGGHGGMGLLRELAEAKNYSV